MYTKLFSEGSIGKLKTKNRLVMSPMGVGLAELDGSPSEDMIAFYEARARGGAGIVIPEITRINDDHGVGLMRQLAVTKDRHIKPLSRLAQAVQKHGSKLIIQLHHPGRETVSALIGGQPVVAPSAIMCKFSRQETRALEHDEVKALVQQYIDGAVRVCKAGCDGVELHSAHGYLIGQFLSPYTNKRTDEYGGSFENRMRFVTEIVQGIRQELGDFTVGVRYSADEFLSANGVTEPYIDLDEGVRIAVALEKLGIDYLNVSCAIYETGSFSVEPISFEQGWRRDMIKAVKDQVSIPVIGVSVIREPQVAEQFLEDEIVDFVSMGRSWLADPEWGIKVLEGRERELNKCISCLRCFESLSEYNRAGIPLECAVNPRCAREHKYGQLEKAVGGEKAVIVGGGPAGLSAARTLAMRNVKVTLFEKKARLGGQINIGKEPPCKSRMDWFTQYYENELERLGADVRLNTEATPELIKAADADAVIIAAGGVPIVPETIPGIKGSNVTGVDEVLSKKIILMNQNVAVIGAGMTGIETAELLEANGNKVTIVEMLDKVAPDGYPTNVMDVMSRIKDADILLQHTLKKITDTGIEVETADGEIKQIPVDTIVLSLGYHPDTRLAEALKDECENLHIIGDASKVGRIAPAVRGGYEIGRELFRDVKAPSFITSAEDLPNFSRISLMGDQQGIYLNYLSDPAAIARVLPPPLKPFAMPVVTLSVTHIRKPSFGDDYFETILGVLCTHKGEIGQYNVALLLDGPGAEMATQLGRDGCGLPKKIGADFNIKKFGNTVTASVARKGVQLIDIKMELGDTNSSLYYGIGGVHKPGEQTQGYSYYITCTKGSDPLGKLIYKESCLLKGLVETDYHAWEPGHVTLKMNSSKDDPWGELPVNTVIGGAWVTNDLCMKDMKVVAQPDPQTTLPYLLQSRYDRSAFMETGRD